MTAPDTHRQIHLAAHFPGVNQQTVWSDPEAGSQIDWDSFRRFAEIAERGLMDYIFLAEGLRLREQNGQIHDLDVVGRPNTVGVLSALAAITDHIGLVGTLSATYNEPADLARQLRSLDVLSGGRAGWNVVTTTNAFTGANFRKGDHLPHEQRYLRAQEMISALAEIWAAPLGGEVSLRSRYFDVDVQQTLPASPQQAPVLVQAGISLEGRDLAARNVEVIFSPFGQREAGQDFRSDLDDRLGVNGRAREDLIIMPGISFALGDTEAEAQERAYAIRRAQVSPPTALAFLEQIWGRDLRAYDPDGPLPDIDPSEDDPVLGRVPRERGFEARLAKANQWRAEAERGGLSIRDLAVREYGAPSVVGTPEQVADELIARVDARACDGYTLIGHLVPDGLAEFVDRVVPILQERGAYRAEYPEGATLRDLLGTTAATPVPLETVA
ncbi:LLM class flavin-dependent oxidoreductase [Parenemella sanctibonifatiensis]|uniref:F420-dependent methylene-tetrahydromethanopterin reductase n=1 Tax=Parenemella sanctibonifatiensis TaxID=2016505 RepID=A0A255EIS6_9ACTN|nr:LLM class flavin-dependent oxidoreductase [Parenemella sanctibonifatiensis]OYN89525.1 F420-dependent methylene-tetrahydromethanopterin reductase [Parenemella sanctibonifatiensis]